MYCGHNTGIEDPVTDKKRQQVYLGTPFRSFSPNPLPTPFLWLLGSGPELDLKTCLRRSIYLGHLNMLTCFYVPRKTSRLYVNK